MVLCTLPVLYDSVTVHCLVAEMGSNAGTQSLHNKYPYQVHKYPKYLPPTKYSVKYILREVQVPYIRTLLRTLLRAPSILCRRLLRPVKIFLARACAFPRLFAGREPGRGVADKEKNTKNRNRHPSPPITATNHSIIYGDPAHGLLQMAPAIGKVCGLDVGCAGDCFSKLGIGGRGCMMEIGVDVG